MKVHVPFVNDLKVTSSFGRGLLIIFGSEWTRLFLLLDNYFSFA